MKCSNCGADLADGAKFCGECGTKVAPAAVFCPECGAKLVSGAKFCGECGAKVGSGSTPSAKSEKNKEVASDGISIDKCEINWDGKALAAEMMMPLSDQQVADIGMDFDNLRVNAHEDRVLFVDDAAFDAKFKVFKAEYSNRLGMNMDSFPLFQKEYLIGLIDNGKEGTGKRGTVFTRLGMIVLDADFPKTVEGDEPLDGIVPWKLFYLFSEPRDEKSYRIMKPVMASKSDMVEEALKNKIKADTNKPGGNLNLLLRFGNVGVSAEDIAEFVDGLKGSLAGYDVATEDDEEEEEEED